MVKRFLKNSQRFWADEAGVIGSAELILIITLLGIGAIAGLGTIRIHLVQQFGDFAVALESIDQSYNVTMGTCVSSFEDTENLGDDTANVPPGTGVMSVTEPATEEAP